MTVTSNTTDSSVLTSSQSPALGIYLRHVFNDPLRKTTEAKGF